MTVAGTDGVVVVVVVVVAGADWDFGCVVCMWCAAIAAHCWCMYCVCNLLERSGRGNGIG